VAACGAGRGKARAGALHLLGLVFRRAASTQAGEHLEAIVELASQGRGFPDVVFHAFTDGRDTAPTGGKGVPSANWRRGCARRGRVGTVRRALLTRWTATTRLGAG